MTPLAATATKHNAADDEQESQNERYDISEAREDGRGFGGGREHGIDDPRGAPGQGLYDPTATIERPTFLPANMAAIPATCCGCDSSLTVSIAEPIVDTDSEFWELVARAALSDGRLDCSGRVALEAERSDASSPGPEAVDQGDPRERRCGAHM